jgi:hypothetical protein
VASQPVASAAVPSSIDLASRYGWHKRQQSHASSCFCALVVGEVAVAVATARSRREERRPESTAVPVLSGLLSRERNLPTFAGQQDRVTDKRTVSVERAPRSQKGAPWPERTIPTERPPIVGEVSANFCG